MAEQCYEELISVIIPVYNVENYLGSCLESVVRQTYKNLEIILVDDGSTDSSGELCETYKNKDSRIWVIHQDNKGLAGARNTGIDRARGKYLFFVDSDDFIDSMALEKLMELINKTSADIAVGQYTICYEEKEIRKTEYTGAYKMYSAEEALSKLNDWRNEETTSLITAWGTLYKKDVFEGIRYPIGKWHEDEFVTHKVLARAEKICVLEDSIYFYRQHRESFMSTVDAHSQIRHMVLFEALQERVDFFDKCYPKLVNAAVHHILREGNSFYDIFCQDKQWKSDKEIKKAAKETVNAYKKVYVKYKKQLTWKEKIMGGIFCVFPAVYHKVSDMKWRNRYGKAF